MSYTANIKWLLKLLRLEIIWCIIYSWRICFSWRKIDLDSNIFRFSTDSSFIGGGFVILACRSFFDPFAFVNRIFSCCKMLIISFFFKFCGSRKRLESVPIIIFVLIIFFNHISKSNRKLSLLWLKEYLEDVRCLPWNSRWRTCWSRRHVEW